MRSPQEIFDLTGKTALVTGSSRGLGKQFAGTLAAAGAEVMLTATQIDSVKKVEDEFRAAGFKAHSFAANMCEQADMDALVANCQEVMGGVDILVANAGIEIAELVEDITNEAMQRAIQVNLAAPIQLTRALSPGMKDKGWGRLIYLSSISGYQGQGDTGHSVYSATKVGINGFLQTVSMELGRHGITANSIVPGVFLTDLAKDGLEAQGAAGQGLYNAYASMTSLGRWGDPAELEGALLLLASEAGSYISGSALFVDGGARATAVPMSNTR